jgi:outer membrane protein
METHQSVKYQMKRIYTIALLLGSISLHAQDAQKFSFSEAISYAEQNNTSYKNAKLDVNIAKETVKQTASYGLPQVSASAGYQQYITIPGNWVNNFTKVPGSSAPDFIFLQFQQEFASSANINVNQLLFDGTYIVGLQATKAFMGMSELLKSKSLKDLQLNVAKAYITAVSTQKNLDLIEANIKLLEKSAFEVKEMNKEGFVESLDVDRLNLTLSNLYIQQEKLQNAIIITKNVLKIHLALPMEANIELTDNLEQLESSLNIADIQNNAFDAKNRIEHQILDQSVSLGLLDKKRYQASALPSLVGFYQYQRSTLRSEFNFFQSNLPENNQWVPSSMYGMSLRVPIFAGGMTRSKISETNIKIEKAKNELANFDRYAEFEYLNAKNGYAVNVKQAENQKSNLALAQRIYDKATLKYKEGVGSTLEMMQAETELRTANNNYMNAIYDLVLSKIEFQHATGNPIK